MKGKTVLITGATDGIGKSTAIELAKKGASIFIHGRNKLRGIELQDMIQKETGNEFVKYVNANLASLTKVNELVRFINNETDHLDVLINNAGVFSREQNFTSDRIELTFAVNHLSHFNLTIQLLPLLIKSGQGRVITVSSVAHTSSPKIDFDDLQEINSYMDYSAYALSKMANVLFSVELAERLNGHAVTSNSLHPGVITTKLLYNGFGISGSSVEEGCKTSVYLASDDNLSGVSGKYFVNSKESEASPLAFDPGLRKNLWSLSEEITQLNFSDFV
jgi:NAD(P)-dependent dehydrogenase (short-subunit alcohol dehydrogenase family)